MYISQEKTQRNISPKVPCNGDTNGAKKFLVCRNECDIVFGGDCFDQFASDFNECSWKTVSI